MDLRRVDAVGGGEIKCVEGLHFGEARLAQALADHGLVPRGVLGTEDLVQIVFVRPMGVARLTGEAVKRPCHTRQLQCARLRDDQIVGDGGHAHAVAPISQVS